jgi:hypothetical protein
MRYLVCLSIILCVAAAFAQQSSTQSNEAATASTATSPVAYVYVSGTPKDSSTGEIAAYTTNPDGTLTPIPGSPFRESLSYMAATGTYLFGATRDGNYIDSFSIESNGALHYSTRTDLSKYSTSDSAVPAGIWLDHTGATLYNLEYLIDGSNSAYQSFAIDKTNGSLSMPGDLSKTSSNTLSAVWPAGGSTLAFTASNLFAYSATCFSDKAWEIYGFERHSDGYLTELNIDPALPTAKSGDGFCPMPLAAADPDNPDSHVAFAFQAETDPPFGTADGPPQLATYTVSADGNLTTTSTDENMPAVKATDVVDMKMSWSGKLLAVGGSGGLEVFHFNGADPITPYTGLLTTDPIVEVSWDSDNHLYAISESAGKLYVFAVTPTSVKQMPGSPHSVSGAQDLVIHSIE